MSLAVLSCYYNFNNNPWMEKNTRHCAKQWRQAGAHVVVVELAMHDAPFVFHPTIDEGDDDTRNLFHKLIQCRVHDVMWYTEMALNIALSHVPPRTHYVAWFDNDVYIVPPADRETQPDWWVEAVDRAFQQNPNVVLLQPFSKAVLTTETVRNGLLGSELDTSHSGGEGSAKEGSAGEAQTNPEAKPEVARWSDEEAIRKCERMARVRPSIMMDRQGVAGYMWVARARAIQSCGFFQHSYIGGGHGLLLNLLQGATHTRATPVALPVVDNPLQRYYFQERGPFARNLMRYRKKWQMHTSLPARLACLPCTLMHLHHGELEKRTTHIERFQFLHTKQFNATRHVCANPEVSGLLMWSQAFRATGVNQEMQQSFERSQTVRDMVLLRMERTRRCMNTIRTQVASLQNTRVEKEQTDDRSHHALHLLLKECLRAFDTVDL